MATGVASLTWTEGPILHRPSWYLNQLPAPSRTVVSVPNVLCVYVSVRPGHPQSVFLCILAIMAYSNGLCVKEQRSFIFKLLQVLFCVLCVWVVMPVSVCVLCAWACSSLTCQQRDRNPLLLQLHRVVGQHMGAQELNTGLLEELQCLNCWAISLPAIT